MRTVTTESANLNIRAGSARFGCVLLLVGAVAACGGGGGSGGSPVATPPAPPPQPQPLSTFDFATLEPLVENFPVADMALVIGDGSGEIYSYQKGSFTNSTPVLIASANKWLTGATIWRLIENGTLAQFSNPQDYIDFWTSEAIDQRSEVTLDQLLGLTSGFNNSPAQTECINDFSYSLYACVQSLYDGGLDTLPGSSFYYGPEHFQIAALVASEAQGGRNFQEIMREVLFDPAGMSALTRYGSASNDNARYSGGIISTAADYGLFLQHIVSGDLISDLEGFTASRTSGVFLGSRPGGVEDNMLDWQYAFGFWIECDSVPFDENCITDPVISSPGAFGFTPWIDLGRGYWGIIAYQDSSLTPGFRPGAESVGLEQQIQSRLEDHIDP